MRELLKITTKEICTDVGEIEFDMKSMKELTSILGQYLQSKKCMLVCQDVWRVEFLKVLITLWHINDKGSKIIITTRNPKIFGLIGGFSSYDVTKPAAPLSEAMSWELFCGIAFQYENEQCCPPELVQLSLRFVRMDESLQFATVTIAELLSKKEKTVSEWKRQLDNFSSEVESNFYQTGASKILSLSYLDLPPQLKLCFLYFSIFPQDYLIPNDKLYKLWIAEGFVEEIMGMTLEIVAEEYLNELIRRNLVQASEGFYGLEKLCRVHSLVHEIAQQKANEFSFCRIWEGRKSSFRGKSCRLAVSNYNMANVLETNEDSQLRSVFLFHNISALDGSFVVILCEKYKLLTLLDFEDVELEHLPNELGNLFLLKYLNLKNTKVKRLPKAVGKLHNLQSLDLRNTLLMELPVEIKKLQNLRHLLASGYDNEITLDSSQGVKINDCGCTS